MAFTRAYEEADLSPDLRRLYTEARSAFDLPFVPTIFKLLAKSPEYLKTAWGDLEDVAASKEFQAASLAMEEFIRSEAIRGGWQFSEQETVLAAQHIARGDMPVLGGIVGTFVRALPRMVLFSRLLQRGFSGGQKGRVSDGKQSPAFSRMVTVHIPNERDAGIRAWLIYSEIKRRTGAPFVPNMFRVLSPYPGYLASVWIDCKKVSGEKNFLRARDAVMKRSLGLLSGLPVRDHRALCKNVPPDQWKEIEETVDAYARIQPQLALLAAVWLRSFADYRGKYAAA